MKDIKLFFVDRYIFVLNLSPDMIPLHERLVPAAAAAAAALFMAFI